MRCCGQSWWGIQSERRRDAKFAVYETIGYANAYFVDNGILYSISIGGFVEEDNVDFSEYLKELIVTAQNECRGQLKHWWRTRREDAAALDTLAWNQPESGLVWKQVAALPEKYRLVLYLHYYQGYATDEIAQILRQNPSTVRSWLLRARKKLKLRLEAEGYGS